jgi:hypothetical protein
MSNQSHKHDLESSIRSKRSHWIGVAIVIGILVISIGPWVLKVYFENSIRKSVAGITPAGQLAKNQQSRIADADKRIIEVDYQLSNLKIEVVQVKRDLDHAVQLKQSAEDVYNASQLQLSQAIEYSRGGDAEMWYYASRPVVQNAERALHQIEFWSSNALVHESRLSFLLTQKEQLEKHRNDLEREKSLLLLGE